MKNYLLSLLAALLAVLPCAFSGAEASDAPVFFALCMDTHDSAKRSIPAQNQLLRDLGYDGVGHLTQKNLKARVESAKKLNLKLSHVYLTVDINRKTPLPANLAEAYSCLKGTDTIVAVSINGGKPSDPALDDKAVRIITDLLKITDPLGVHVALYPHLSSWNEKVADCVRIAERFPDKKVGVMFNLCHWAAVDKMENLDAVLKLASPYLISVTIHGCDMPAEIQSKKGKWIQPLDSGSFDVEMLLRKLKDIGFTGSIGLQCYGLSGDAEIHLKRSIKKWNELKQKIYSKQQLPEPILPLSEAGKFVPQLEKLRAAMEKRQWKEFKEVGGELWRETTVNGKINGKNRNPEDPFKLTKEEFAAQEWLFYYACKMGLPTYEEMWNLDFDTRQCGITSTLWSEMKIIFDNESFGIDDKNLRRIRATWSASLLKRFRARKKEIEEKFILIRPIVEQQHRIKLLRENPDRYIDRDVSGWRQHFWDMQQFSGEASYFWHIWNSAVQCERVGYDTSFIYLLFESFPDDTNVISEHIKMAGFSLDYESCSFWVKMLKYAREASQYLKKDHASNYLKSVGMDAKKISELSIEAFDKALAAEKKGRDKWEKLRPEMRAEEQKLWEEIGKRTDKYWKEEEAKGKKRPTGYLY